MEQKPIIGVTPDYSYEKRNFKLSEDYTNAILQAGGIPILLTPCHEFPTFVDGILLSGGGDVDPLLFGEEPLLQNGEISPLRDNWELSLCKKALQHQMPLLGICRGMQIMNIAAGGSIYQDIIIQTGTTLKHSQQAPRFYGTHSVTVVPESLLAKLWQKEKVVVNSVHHQAVSKPGNGFFAAAHSHDALIEAIEHKTIPFALGVQWHPEAMKQKEQQAIFCKFTEAAIQYRDRRK